MTTQLKNLSVPELKTLSAEIAVELKGREGAAFSDARARVLAIAKEAGLSVQELVSGSIKPAKVTVPVKYRSPENANQVWSGRGRQPDWVKDWIAAGKTMESLEV